MRLASLNPSVKLVGDSRPLADFSGGRMSSPPTHIPPTPIPATPSPVSTQPPASHPLVGSLVDVSDDELRSFHFIIGTHGVATVREVRTHTIAE